MLGYIKYNVEMYYPLGLPLYPLTHFSEYMAGDLLLYDQKQRLICIVDYAIRSCAPLAVVENLEELEDELYECIEDVWPDYPTKEDFLWNEDEY